MNLNIFGRKQHVHDWDLDHPAVYDGAWGPANMGNTLETATNHAFQVRIDCKGCLEHKFLVWRIYEGPAPKLLKNLDGKSREDEGR